MRTCKLQKKLVTWKNTRLCMASIPHPSQRGRSREGKPFTDPCKFWDDGRHHHIMGIAWGATGFENGVEDVQQRCCVRRIGRSRVVTVLWLSRWAQSKCVYPLLPVLQSRGPTFNPPWSWPPYLLRVLAMSRSGTYL